VADLDVSYENTVPAPGALAQGVASFDNGGPVDRICASWVDPQTPDGRVVLAAEQSGWQAYSYDRFGQAYYAPSTVLSVAQFTTFVLGVFVGSYHGYQRTRKAGWAVLWGAFGGILPLPTLAVAAVQGYGKPKRKSR
jgi:hypothetical protein